MLGAQNLRSSHPSFNSKRPAILLSSRISAGASSKHLLYQNYIYLRLSLARGSLRQITASDTLCAKVTIEIRSALDSTTSLLFLSWSPLRLPTFLALPSPDRGHSRDVALPCCHSTRTFRHSRNYLQGEGLLDHCSSLSTQRDTKVKDTGLNGSVWQGELIVAVFCQVNYPLPHTFVRSVYLFRHGLQSPFFLLNAN
ncbi:hypothetical protein L218DRAFT_175305 [Marasmius fiardii PR-910]|nr:hypothetical protein L218DRAFT_175305 [Marasmius fiardii PR-910]